MATRNIVPRATGEGQIGTSAKTWSAGYFNDIAVTNGVTASTFTGDLTGDVTGDVTGNVTGDVTGDVTGTASGNLALTGGTMTGNIEYVGADNREFTAGGFSDSNKDNVDIGWNYDNVDGAAIALRSASHTLSGFFELAARSGANTKIFCGKPNGELQWDAKEIERVNASGTNYIRFESGLQICWADLGGVNHNTQKNWDFPVAFKDTNYFVCAVCRQLGFGSAMTISAQAGTASQAWIKQWNSASAGTLLTAFAIGWWK